MCDAVALRPEKSSVACETLKERLREEGVLLELVHAVQYHAEQQQPAATSSEPAPDAGRYVAVRVA